MNRQEYNLRMQGIQKRLQVIQQLESQPEPQPPSVLPTTINTGPLEFLKRKLFATAGVAQQATSPVSTLSGVVRGNPQEQGAVENVLRGAGSLALMVPGGGVPVMAEQAVKSGIEQGNPLKPAIDMAEMPYQAVKRQVTGEAQGMTRGQAWQQQPVEEALSLLIPFLAAKGVKGGLANRGANSRVPEIIRKAVEPEVVSEVVQKPIRSETPIQETVPIQQPSQVPEIIRQAVESSTPPVEKPQTPQTITEDLSQRAAKISTEQPTAVQDAVRPAQSTTKAKEPWEMTSGESLYGDIIESRQYKDNQQRWRDIGNSTSIPDMEEMSASWVNRTRESHKLKVEDALEAGKPVPPEVLADYPDLAAKYAKPTTAEAVVKKAGDVEPTELHAGVNPSAITGAAAEFGRSPFMMRQKNEGVLRPFSGIRARLDSPEGSNLVRSVERADEDISLYRGTKHNELKKALGNLTTQEKNDTGLLMSGQLDTASPKVRGIAANAGRIMNQVREDLVNAGIDVGKTVDNIVDGVQTYFPRMLRRDIAMAIQDDIHYLSKQVESIVANEPGGRADAAIAAAFERVAQQKLNKFTVQWIDHAKQQGWGVGKLLRELDRIAESGDLEYMFGNIDKHRRIPTPSSFFETDVSEVLTRYLNGASKRLGLQSNFGDANAGLKNLVQEIYKVDPQQGQTAKHAAEAFLGTYEKNNALSPTAQKIASHISGGVLGSVIGTGYSALVNTLQTLISASQAGFRPSVKALARFGKGIARERAGMGWDDYIDAIRDSGAPEVADAMELMGGKFKGRTVTENVAHKIATPFNKVNKFNQYVSAAMGREYVLDLSKRAMKGDKLAQRILKEDFAIDYTKTISDDTLKKAMYRFSSDTQLTKNVMRDPLWMNNPKTRIWGLLQRFNFRQTQLAIKDITIKEINRGNYKPLVRLLATGIVGGEAYIWAKNKARGIAEGRDVRRDEDWGDYQRYLNDLAAVGTFGLISNMFSSQEVSKAKRASDYVGNTVRGATPFIISKGIEAGKAAQQTVKDVDRLGVLGSLRENTQKGIGLISPLGGQVMQRTRTDAERKASADAEKGKLTPKLRYLFLNGRDDEAIQRIENWNAKHPESPINPNGDYLKRLLNGN